MAYSGTISQTTYLTQQVIDSAFRRCRLKAQQITSEYIEIANQQLYLLLSALANNGVPLWCIEKVLLPLYQGANDVVLPIGTVDTLNQNLRTIQQATGTVTTISTTSTTVFTSDTPIVEVGILWSGVSEPLAFERSEDGVAWTTIQSVAPTGASGQWEWFDVNAVVPAAQFRVRATTGVLNASQVVLANAWNEIPLARMNRDDWFNLPNRAFQNDQPLQFWFDRQVPQPIIHMWPAPNAAVVGKKHISLLRHRQIMDVGTMTQSIEVPQRWYLAIVASLAVACADEIPEVDPAVIPTLEKRKAEALNDAQTEERDNSPIKWMPNIGMYTR